VADAGIPNGARDIYVSCTGSDRDWARWIAAELRAQGDKPPVHEREIDGGGNILEWMEKHHDAADHVPCVDGRPRKIPGLQTSDHKGDRC
jgi:hypothetical protein